MESSWSPHGVHGVYGDSSWSLWRLFMESSWSLHGVLMESMGPCGVSRDSIDFMRTPLGLHEDSTGTLRGLHEDSMKTPPKMHRFYGESMDFGWTMISFGEIYPCRSVISHCLLV